MTDDRARWKGWQQAHQQALADLQHAAQEYHRLVVDQAFAAEDDDTRARRQQALNRLQARQRRLDELREQQPAWPH
ncbi:MAG: hypothetical protein IT178_05625 [Acidobacteria bacterium]|nr:hypothetical protein [Acidobacteriota bacterium]